MSFNDRLIAHRGWRNRFPENTLIAVDAAVQAGAKHVEIDVQLTADHVPILFHDQSLLRMCGTDQGIDTLSLQQLAQFSAYEPGRFNDRYKGTPLTSLQQCAELIAAHPDVTLYVEIKSESLHRFGGDVVLYAVLPLLTAIRNHCYLISFDVPVLAAARQAGWQQIAPVLTELAQLDGEELRQLAPEMVFCDYKLLLNRDPAKPLPFPVAVYEVAQYDAARRWLDSGVTLVETFCIGELMASHQESHHE